MQYHPAYKEMSYYNNVLININIKNRTHEN